MVTEHKIEFDLANERVVLGAMIADPNTRGQLSRELQSTEFGDPRHRVIFEALGALVRSRLDFSEDTLRDLAGRENFGGYEYIRQISTDYSSTANIRWHVDRLRIDASKFRILSEDIPAIVESCRDPRAAPEALYSQLQCSLARVSRLGQRFVARGDELGRLYASEMRVRRSIGDAVERFGFSALDQYIKRGLAPGMSIVVGRPAHGKSTWLANLLRRRVLGHRRTYVFGWEMSRISYLDMMVSGETGISVDDLVKRVRVFSEVEKSAIAKSVKRFTDDDLIAIEQNPFTHLEKPNSRWDVNTRNLDYVESVVRQECERYPVFAFDVISKMLHDRRPDAISEALVRLRELAIGCGVHFLLLHHLNRESAESRPTLEGIKGSGAFEEEADLILGIDRPIMRAASARRKKMTDVLDVHILKQREGPAPLCMRYRFDGERRELTDEIELDISILESEKA